MSPSLCNDYHIHTCLRPIDDGGEEMTPAALADYFRARGCSCFGLSPHFHAGADEGILLSFLENASREAAAVGVRMLKGVEAECVDAEGTLTLSAEARPHLDYVIASADHFNCTGVVRPPKAARECFAFHLELLMRLAANPMVDVIAHPLAAMILLTTEGHLPENEPIETLDGLDDVWAEHFADALVKTHTALEVNGFFTLTYPEKLQREKRPSYLPKYRDFYRRMASRGVTLVPASDAHSLAALRQYDHAAQWLRELI